MPVRRTMLLESCSAWSLATPSRPVRSSIASLPPTIRPCRTACASSIRRTPSRTAMRAAGTTSRRASWRTPSCSRTAVEGAAVLPDASTARRGPTGWTIRARCVSSTARNAEDVELSATRPPGARRMSARPREGLGRAGGKMRRNYFLVNVRGQVLERLTRMCAGRPDF